MIAEVLKTKRSRQADAWRKFMARRNSIEDLLLQQDVSGRYTLLEAMKCCCTLSGPCCVAAGKYELMAVLTHKGRSADSGHYVAWVKQDDKQWIQFDDDELIPRKEVRICSSCHLCL